MRSTTSLAIRAGLCWLWCAALLDQPFQVLAATSAAADAMTLNPSDGEAVRVAQLNAVAALFQHYTPNVFGTFGRPLDMWGESALIWTSIVEYLRTANDIMVLDTFRDALGSASFDEMGDFLGGDLADLERSMNGKTNDKLVLWALVASRGANIFGVATQVASQSATFQEIAVGTWTQLLSGWRNTTCKGGIVTDPSDTSRNATKSSTTNAGFMALSAQLYAMTGNTTYKEWADGTYNWMAETGLITSAFEVYAGLTAECAVQRAQWSAPAGLLMTSLATLYQATTLDPYVGQLTALLSASLGRFTTNANTIANIAVLGDDQQGRSVEPQGFTRPGVLYETLCDFGMDCAHERWGKGVFVQGLADAYRMAPNATYRPSVAKAFGASLAGMMPTCEASWNCSYIWTGKASKPYDLNDQYQTVQLLNAIKLVLQNSDGQGFNGIPAGQPSPSPPVSPTESASVPTSTLPPGDGSNDSNDPPDSSQTQTTTTTTTVVRASTIPIIGGVGGGANGETGDLSSSGGVDSIRHFCRPDRLCCTLGVLVILWCSALAVI
ncbi:glycosyl hydrolase family 76-domain-containing protein [Entophlyctis helioformis]|nr:glycosyl hydrolase family 76-domain-containing protein [Entophlyctis helioformis]